MTFYWNVLHWSDRRVSEALDAIRGVTDEYYKYKHFKIHLLVSRRLLNFQNNNWWLMFNGEDIVE